MNRTRRRAHRAIWLLFAAALPLLLILALRARHPLAPAHAAASQEAGR